MEVIIVVIFILGYLAITLEHSLKVDKLVPALLMMALAWACVAIGIDGFENWFDSANHGLMNGLHGTENFSDIKHDDRMGIMQSTLLHHFGKTCEILIFLVGAMTIVEIIDHFNGFSTIKKFIKTNKKINSALDNVRFGIYIICYN
jgi:Na+/H+ antiporter NhaD/arsenite permease-like protein